MSNLAVTMWRSDDKYAGLRMMRKTLDTRVTKLGARHSDTILSQWWLAVMLQELGESEELARTLEAMKWLLEADDSQLSANQRQAREYVLRELSQR